MLDLLRSLWHPDAIVAFQRVFGPRWTPVFEVLSLLGGHQLVVLAVSYARWFRGRPLTYRLVVAVLLGLAASMIIGALVDSPRPDDPRIRVATEIPISSFPSGHLITCMTIWGTFAAARIVRPWVVALLALLITFGRLGLGQHYPGDLLGGAAIGLAILAVVAWAWPWLRAAAARLTPAQHVAIGVGLAALSLAGTLTVSEDRWELLGLLSGVALGLPIERLAVGYTPIPLAPRLRLAQAAIGLAGIGAYVALAAILDEVAIAEHLLLPAGLALWVLLGAPALFRRLGWSGRDDPAPRDSRLLAGASAR